MNDDSIFGLEVNGDKFYVRRFMSHKDDVIKRLVANITDTDLENAQLF
jgi:hypothetical protein